MTGLTPADILGKPFHEAIQELDCKSTTAKATSLATLHERVTAFSSKKKTTSSTEAATPTKCRIHVSVVGTEPAAAGDSTKQHDMSYMTHYMISLGEEEEDTKTDSEEETTVSATAASTSTARNGANANFPLAVPASLPMVLEPSHNHVSLFPMRVHCGVMG